MSGSGRGAAPDERRQLARRFDQGPLRRRRLLWPLRRLVLRGGILVGRGTQRLVDVAASLVLVAVTLPVLLLLLVVSGGRIGIARSQPLQGYMGRVFHRHRLLAPQGWRRRLVGWLRLDRLPVLANILWGDMTLVGPRPLPPGAFALSDPAARRRLEVRPGLVSLWWLRDRTNIAYDPELEIDAEYVEGRSVRGDLGILLRSLLTLFYGGRTASTAQQIEILGIPVANASMDEALAAILSEIDGGGPAHVCFTNPHCANLAQRDPQYLESLRRARLNLVDGIGMKVAGSLLSQPLKENVNGTDLFPRLCTALAERSGSVFLLGGKPGVAEDVGAWIASHAPGLQVCGMQHGYFEEDEEERVVAAIAAARPDVLLVAFGVPRQDTWLATHLPATRARVGMGVGGLFDFYSGRMPRAPQWLRELGLEWAFRLYQEPGRMWRRYLLGNAIFVVRVLWQRLRGTPGKEPPA